MRAVLALAAATILAACSVPDKYDSLPEHVWTSSAGDVVLGAVAIRADGTITQHGGLFSGATTTGGGYRLPFPGNLFRTDGGPTCTCTTAAGPCSSYAAADALMVTPQADMQVICVGETEIPQTGTQLARALVVVPDRSPTTLATATISSGGDVSADGGWITGATRTGARWDVAVAPVFASAPICTCAWVGGLADDCEMTSVSTSALAVQSRGDGSTATALHVMCVGATAPPTVELDDFAVAPGDRGTVIASASIDSANTVQWEDGFWIESVTGGDGDHIVHLDGRVFEGPPRCTCSSASGCTFATSDADSVHVRVTDGAGVLAANAFLITCAGPRRLR